MEPVRIQKYISQTGYCSRRNAEKLLLDGRIKVNNQTVTELGIKIDPDRDQITIDGKPLKLPAKKLYFAYHKPAGVVSTHWDPHTKKTMAPVLEGQEPLKFAGRLDKDTSGLMLLSNDGAFINKVTHPRYECEKEYLGTTHDPISPKAFNRILKGGFFYGEHYQPVEGELNGRNRFRMILTEGKKRQIRQMMKSIRAQVKTLKRVRIGRVELKDLPVDELRPLTPPEIKYFLRLPKA